MAKALTSLAKLAKALGIGRYGLERRWIARQGGVLAVAGVGGGEEFVFS